MPITITNWTPMETTNRSSDWLNQKKLILIFVAAALCFAALTLIPSVRAKLQGYFTNPNRQVLAKITGYFSSDQNHFLIIKIQDSAGLQIEIYELNSQSGAQTFKQKFELIEDADSYVTLDRNSTNLALQDVDQDGNLDIIAPSVDRNGNLRLNTFRFDAELKLFEPFTKQE